MQFGIVLVALVAAPLCSAVAISSSTSYQLMLSKMFSTPHCQNFLFGSWDQSPVNENSNCGGRACNVPQEMCFVQTMHDFDNLDAERFSCIPVPNKCRRAANGEDVGPVAPPPVVPVEPVDPVEPVSSANVCQLPKKNGRACYRNSKSRSSITRSTKYFFNAKRNKCVKIVFYSCATPNGNLFQTAKDCKATCLSDPAPAPAPVPKPVFKADAACGKVFRRTTGKYCKGQPRQVVTHYGYNKKTGQCAPVKYRGCAGSQNRFETIAICKQKCIGN